MGAINIQNIFFAQFLEVFNVYLHTLSPSTWIFAIDQMLDIVGGTTSTVAMFLLYIYKKKNFLNNVSGWFHWYKQ